MQVSRWHLLRQGPVIASLVRTAGSGLKKKPSGAKAPVVQTPAPLLSQIVPPRNPKLIADFIRHVGGNPAAYSSQVPPHLFPQWGFPILARTLAIVPYDLSRILNGGARINIHRPIPQGEPLHLRARLLNVDDNGRRVVFTQQLITGTPSAPEALESLVTAILPLKGGSNGKKEAAPPREEKARPKVPLKAYEIGRWQLSDKSGLEFAMVTGDFNPVHWIGMYARASGFPNVISHGFATLARTLETLNTFMWSGQPGHLKHFEARFVRPLVLPADVGVFVDYEGGIFVGRAPGSPAYLVGNYATGKENG